MLELFQHEHQPVKQYWLLMKVAPLERLQQMQKGFIDMKGFPEEELGQWLQLCLALKIEGLDSMVKPLNYDHFPR